MEYAVPDTVTAALERETPTVDAICSTNAGSIASTSKNATADIAVTSTRSVEVTIEISDLTDATDYELEVTLGRLNTATKIEVDEITDTVAFTSSGTTETVVYDVPVNTDYDYLYKKGVATVTAV